MFFPAFDCYHLNRAQTRLGPEHICATKPEPMQTSKAGVPNLCVAKLKKNI
jgi:hypothetical protein